MKIEEYQLNHQSFSEIFLDITHSKTEMLKILCWSEENFSIFTINENLKQIINSLTNAMKGENVKNLRNSFMIIADIKQSYGYDELICCIEKLWECLKYNENLPKIYADTFLNQTVDSTIKKIKIFFQIREENLRSFLNNADLSFLVQIYESKLLEPCLIYDSLLEHYKEILKKQVNLFFFLIFYKLLYFFFYFKKKNETTKTKILDLILNNINYALNSLNKK